ncbi:antitoxin [Saccharopolyspora sp. NPDC000359]|uniref:antitoxin n=1 Tax=Saccharopolyspora sp. NPDC000359 TaxID=3154251 RepID=UPI00332BFD47
MGLGDFKDKMKDMARGHGDKVDKGVDAAAGKAKEKYGHEEQVDKAAEKGKEYLADDSKPEPDQQ